MFPRDLIDGAVPNNWVVLDIVNSSGEYVVKFVVKYGPDLTNFMLRLWRILVPLMRWIHQCLMRWLISRQVHMPIQLLR